MTIQFRNNVHTAGKGSVTLVFMHGLGCDRTMWRFITPRFEDRFRVITFDLVGSGRSDLSAYDPSKYSTLHGYAHDLLEIIDAEAGGPVVVIGHSVSAMIGLLATIEAPQRFLGQIMVGPSPCYINDGEYIGGFNRDDMNALLDSMDENFLAWSIRVAPMIMGARDHPALAEELTEGFVRSNQAITKHFARVAFLSDHRQDLARSTVPALILQCSDDLLVPREVGEYLHRQLKRSILRVIDNTGHCPHLSAPSASAERIERFLDQVLRS
jgi:sigma-B regulation protein RsbQ